MDYRVIKENDLFLMADNAGNVPVSSGSPYGLFAQDTRMLSRLVCTMGPMRLIQLDADASENYIALYHYTNEELRVGDALLAARESMLVTRKQFVDGARFYEELTVLNYSAQPVEFSVAYELSADFEDMFVVRGFTKNLPSEPVHAEIEEGGAVFSYTAQDGIQTKTVARLTSVSGAASQPCRDAEMDADAHCITLRHRLTVQGRGEAKWILVIDFAFDGNPLSEHRGHGSGDDTVPTRLATTASVQESMEAAKQRVADSYRDWLTGSPNVTGNAAFSTWYRRGLLDLRMLLTDTGCGPFAVAGVPWFAVLFGRDSLLSATQLLCVHPEVAKGTLRTMAKYQGQNVDPWRDEQPGKIMHELRAGELTRTNQVPFGPYYGTIDATPLFLILAAEYFKWTGDRRLIETILDHAVRAFQWIDADGDRDQDGLIEYSREAERGIANQGWKDSGDAIVHKDGTLATGPIALCEVQGYVYRAYQLWSELFAEFEHHQMAADCASRAERLRSVFLERFWIEEVDAVSLAIDGQKNQVASLSSNMGQVLWSGILPAAFAKRVVKRLLARDMFSGYGIRTLASSETAYNPLSYHNGTVWPHDNSFIIAGMQRYGQSDAVATLVGGLLNAAQAFQLMRLPELFAGYGMDEFSRPMPYPVSCSPQAWAAASPMLALQALLGLDPDVPSGCLCLNPTLPLGVDALTVSGIRVGAGELDVLLQRAPSGETIFAVQKNTTGLRVLIGPAMEVVMPTRT